MADTHRSTIMKIAVHHEDVSPVFGEGVINVELTDDSAGIYILLSQDSPHDPVHAGKVGIDYQHEWPLIKAAVERLMGQEGVK